MMFCHTTTAWGATMWYVNTITRDALRHSRKIKVRIYDSAHLYDGERPRNGLWEVKTLRHCAMAPLELRPANPLLVSQDPFA
eukprot:2559712-Amphidinium_carterae.1